MSNVIFEDKERQIKITSHGLDDHVVVKFGELEISMNKAPDKRDIAYEVRGGFAGVIFDYDAKPDDARWRVHEPVTKVRLWYLHEAKRKLEALKDAYQILQEKD